MSKSAATASYSIVLSLMAALLLTTQSGCLFRNSKPAQPAVTQQIQLALLPFSVPEGNKELQWTAMAAPILMMKAAEHWKEIEILPLYETMPATIETAGASRILDEESAATIATWVSAKWSVHGRVAPASGNRVSVTVDFIPAKRNQVAFRYMKTWRMSTVGLGFREAYSQFLRYMAVAPAQPLRKGEPSMTAMRELAEALDLEYGWSVEAQPGKAQEFVSDLLKTDLQLAKHLFNPVIYPALAEAK